MITIQQTPVGDNNETIWVLKIHTSTPIYIATKDITLNSTFDGQVLNIDNYLSDLAQSSTIQSSGGTGSVSSYSLSISRYVTNTSLDGFFNEFYPNGTEYLTSKIIDMGICWEGATADTDITWLHRGRVIDYGYEQRQLNLTIFQESEITNREIPYYSIQKDFDNGVSYYTRAPLESYGITIPIIYGDLAQGTGAEALAIGSGTALSPAIPIHKRAVKFIICSHECYNTSEDNALLASTEFIFKYVDGTQSYLFIRNENYATDSETENTIIKHTLTMANRGSSLVGAMVIRLAEQSQMSDVVDVDNAIDNNSSSYSDLDANGAGNERFALKPIGSASTQDVGYLGTLDADIGAYFMAGTDGGGNRNVTINYYNNTLASPAGDDAPSTDTLTSATARTLQHQFGINTAGKKDTVMPWTIEEICSLDYYVENDQTTPGQKVRIYYGYLRLEDIKVFSPNWARAVRQNSGGRQL